MEGIVFLVFIDEEGVDDPEEFAYISDKSVEEIRKRADEIINEWKKSNKDVGIEMINHVISRLYDEGYIKDIPLEMRFDDVRIYY